MPPFPSAAPNPGDAGKTYPTTPRATNAPADLRLFLLPLFPPPSPGGTILTCPQCVGIEKLFNERTARRELKRYRKKGPIKSTRILLELLRTSDVKGASLLDVGGGIGIIQHELVRAGVARTLDVDASHSYLTVARAEAERRGYKDRATYLHGDFVELAPQVSPADIVTLDRVVCCYPDADALVRLSARRSKRLYGLVLPREKWWFRAFAVLGNSFMRVTRNPFRMYVHPTARLEEILRVEGLRMRAGRRTLFWQILVYERRVAG